jgi:hypothetical protein
VISSAIWDESAFLGRRYSLGLDKALDIFTALEQAALKAVPASGAFTPRALHPAALARESGTATASPPE